MPPVSKSLTTDTAGVVGGTITETSPPPVNAYDAAFYLHDLVYQSSSDPAVRLPSDVQLAETLTDLAQQGGGNVDVLTGGEADDVLVGDDGADWIYGGLGNDQLLDGGDDQLPVDGHGFLPLSLSVIPGRAARIGAARRPSAGSGANPQSITTDCGYGFRHSPLPPSRLAPLRRT